VSDPNIPRIGRPANAAERGLQLATEAPDVLEAMAENVYLEAHEYTQECAERFRALSDEEREPWRVKALQLQREHTEQYVEPTDPDDPEPGGRRPLDNVRVA
jgi:hypothetical protein